MKLSFAIRARETNGEAGVVPKARTSGMTRSDTARAARDDNRDRSRAPQVETFRTPGSSPTLGSRASSTSYLLR
jgi:hypothetical protein